MVGTQLYIITQISTYNYMFRPCILYMCVGTHAHIVQLLIMFIIQPDDGQYTGPKHVVVCTNLCDNIQLCSDHIFVHFSDYIIDQHNGDDSSRIRTPHILNLGARWRCMASFNSCPLYPQEVTLIPNELEAGWIPEPVWTFWVREKIHASVGIRNRNRRTCNLVTVQTMQSQFCRCPLWPEYFPK